MLFEVLTQAHLSLSSAGGVVRFNLFRGANVLDLLTCASGVFLGIFRWLFRIIVGF